MNRAQQSDPALRDQPPTGQTAGKVVPPGGMPGDQLQSNRPPEMNPGDALPDDALGAGETICYACSGSGRIEGERCSTCAGTGKVIEAVSGGP
jgi:hypothetical protein